MPEQTPSITPEQIASVRASYDKIAPIRATAGALFYRRLFELDPELRPLFRSNLQLQAIKLMSMIELIVDNLGQFEQLLPQVQALGRAHVGYGARDANYDTVETALLWTLRIGLEEQFTSTDEAAWGAAYGLISETMKAAARQSVSENQ
jgi:hemoglobin-like flavoprotein